MVAPSPALGSRKEARAFSELRLTPLGFLLVLLQYVLLLAGPARTVLVAEEALLATTWWVFCRPAPEGGVFVSRNTAKAFCGAGSGARKIAVASRYQMFLANK